ncbi:MAG TPA: hypothetical protein VHC69_01095 [Polyangiaceae bacterium]|nr:hypothetical protein [Polyangiaceae bacterium]
MKLARLGAAALPFWICLSPACSDPPSPPAQAAVWVQATQPAGKVCTTTNGRFGIPSKYNSSVLAELNCDLSMGCHPDDYVVVDRDTGSSVTCSVSGSSGSYSVQLSLIVDGSNVVDGVSMNFSLSGTLTDTGGTVAINESNSVAVGGGSETDCTVTIAPPKGLIAKGKVWGSFDCPNFRDQSNIGDTGCDVSGQFLFENCGS